MAAVSSLRPSPGPSLRPVSGTAEEVTALLREWEAAQDPPPLVIETSGSTGEPKRVALSRAAMRASAHATHERLGGPGHWELNLPPTYVAGVQVLFRTILAGPDVTRRYLSLVPTQLFRALAGDVDHLAALDAVLVGGGPLDPAVRAEAERRGIRVVQTYGMSETCGGCVYDGVPLDGVEVRIHEGEVQLRGPVLFDGYDGDPARTAATMQGGWLRTQDLGELVGGRLRVTGRVDDVIISGGLKVPGPAVERMLAQHPAVEEVAVVGVPDDEWGERVVAFYVRGDAPLEGLDLAVVPHAWSPKQWVAVEEIPTLPNGKPDRVRMRSLA
jgi:O-succinylbenzoic acid--CoA ligase